MWNALQKHTNSFIKPLKYLDTNNIEYDIDCLSRGQLKSKKWLIDNLKELNLDQVQCFYVLVGMLHLNPRYKKPHIKFTKIRSFDIDP